MSSKVWKAFKYASLVLVLLVAGVSFGIYSYISKRHRVVERPQKTSAILISDVSVVDVVHGKTLPHQDVLLDKGTIQTIRPHNEASPKPPNAETIDGKGLSLVPGLIDIHCHLESSIAPPWKRVIPLADENMERLLYSGITRVFDPGGMVPGIFELRKEVNQGERLGPRTYAAGPLFTAPGGHPAPMVQQLAPPLIGDHMLSQMTRQVSTQEEASTEVKAILEHKPDFIKIVVDSIPDNTPKLSPEMVQHVANAAKAGNVRSVAHIGSTEDAIVAAEAGVSAWIHGVYKEKISDENIQKLASYKIPMSPTMVVFKNYSKMGREKFNPIDLEREIVPKGILDAYDNQPDHFHIPENTTDFLSLLAEQQENALSNVQRLHKAGVTILAGSDAQTATIHGPSLHRELHLLSKAGLSPLEVLRSATLHSARFLSKKEDPPFGIVAEGKVADLILVQGNPLENPKALDQIKHVILQGTKLERRPLKN